MPPFPWPQLIVISTTNCGLLVLGFIQKHRNKVILTKGNTQCSLGCDAADGGGPDWQRPSLPVWLCGFWYGGRFLRSWAEGSPTDHQASRPRGSKDKVSDGGSARWQGEECSSEAGRWLCQKAELLGGGTRLSGSLAKCLPELVTWRCLAIARTPSATSRPQAQPERRAALQRKAAN